MHEVKLLTLHCHISDESDLDEVYLKFDGKKIWPVSGKYQKMDLGETVLNISITRVTKGAIVEIELWDYDILSKDDNLGSFHLNLDSFGGGFSTEMKKISKTQASYSLDWEFY